MLSEKPWRPELVMRLMFGVLASVSLGTMLVQGLLPKGEGVTPTLPIFFVGTLSFHGIALVLVNVFLRQHQISWSEAFGFNTPRLGRTLFFAVITMGLVLPLALALGQLGAKILTLFHQPVRMQQAVETLQTSTSMQERVCFGIAAIIAAPFVEETLFRGILYPAIKRSGWPRMALWGTSVLFAATHANWMTMLPLTFLAVVLTLLYETTNNLIAPIVTHALFNAANFFWLLHQLDHAG